MAGYSTERDNEDRARRSQSSKDNLLFAKQRYKSAISNILFCVHELMLIVFSDWFIFCWRWLERGPPVIDFFLLSDN